MSGDLSVSDDWRNNAAREPSLTTACGHWVRFDMVFTKRLRGRVRRGIIKCSIRIWTRPHVKVGGRYPIDEGHIVVDSIEQITLADITDELETKIMGISLYESQIDRLFDGTKAMANAVRSHGRVTAELGGVDGSAERYWVSGRV